MKKIKTIITKGVEYILTPKIQNPTMEFNKMVEWGESSEKPMTFKDAKKWCEELGGGWRLPTLFELCLAYERKIKGFRAVAYWSSDENNTIYSWRTSFSDGSLSNNYKICPYYVRLVRDID